MQSLGATFFGMPGSNLEQARASEPTPPVPMEYQDLHAALSSKISSFERMVSGLSAANGNGQHPVAFSAELKSAHSVYGRLLLDAGHYREVLLEMDSLKALGVNGIIVNILFPTLYAGYYQSQEEYQQYLALYNNLAADIRSRGLELIVNSGTLSSDEARSFYDSLTLDQYKTARMEMAKAIAVSLKPDYLSVISEPAKEAAQSGKPELDTVGSSLDLLSTILNGLQQAHVQNVKIGAGVETGNPSYLSFIQAFAGTEVDYIDMQVNQVNLDYLDRILQIADLAASHGKPIAISEAWLAKIRDSELDTLAGSDLAERNAFGFWSGVDAQFAAAMTEFASRWDVKFASLDGNENLQASLDRMPAWEVAGAQLIFAQLLIYQRNSFSKHSIYSNKPI